MDFSGDLVIGQKEGSRVVVGECWSSCALSNWALEKFSAVIRKIGHRLRQFLVPYTALYHSLEQYGLQCS